MQSTQDVRIVGTMVVGPGEADRWLEQVLDQRKKLCDDVIICGNNTDEKTEKLVKKYGFWYYRDDREWGIYQPQIKADLLHKVAKLRPTSVLPSDADEIYDKYFTREEAEKLSQVATPGFYFAVINLWSDEQHYRHDLSFWNVRFFNFHITARYGLHFEKKRLHCGLAPPIVYKYGMSAPFILKHYGLMKPEDREKKVARYEKYDPDAKFKDRSYYEKLKDNLTVRPFDEDRMHEIIAKDAQQHGYKKEFV